MNEPIWTQAMMAAMLLRAQRAHLEQTARSPERRSIWEAIVPEPIRTAVTDRLQPRKQDQP